MELNKVRLLGEIKGSQSIAQSQASKTISNYEIRSAYNRDIHMNSFKKPGERKDYIRRKQQQRRQNYGVSMFKTQNVRK